MKGTLDVVSFSTCMRQPDKHGMDHAGGGIPVRSFDDVRWEDGTPMRGTILERARSALAHASAKADQTKETFILRLYEDTDPLKPVATFICKPFCDPVRSIFIDGGPLLPTGTNVDWLLSAQR